MKIRQFNMPSFEEFYDEFQKWKNNFEKVEWFDEYYDCYDNVGSYNLSCFFNHGLFTIVLSTDGTYFFNEVYEGPNNKKDFGEWYDNTIHEINEWFVDYIKNNYLEEENG